jgi:hypothetical protein
MVFWEKYISNFSHLEHITGHSQPMLNFALRPIIQSSAKESRNIYYWSCISFEFLVPIERAR